MVFVLWNAELVCAADQSEWTSILGYSMHAIEWVCSSVLCQTLRPINKFCAHKGQRMTLSSHLYKLWQTHQQEWKRLQFISRKLPKYHFLWSKLTQQNSFENSRLTIKTPHFLPTPGVLEVLRRQPGLWWPGGRRLHDHRLPLGLRPDAPGLGRGQRQGHLQRPGGLHHEDRPGARWIQNVMMQQTVGGKKRFVFVYCWQNNIGIRIMIL